MYPLPRQFAVAVQPRNHLLQKWPPRLEMQAWQVLPTSIRDRPVDAVFRSDICCRVMLQTSLERVRGGWIPWSIEPERCGCHFRSRIIVSLVEYGRTCGVMLQTSVERAHGGWMRPIFFRPSVCQFALFFESVFAILDAALDLANKRSEVFMLFEMPSSI